MLLPLRRALATLLWIIAAVILVFGLPLAWIFRDGMAVGVVGSRGLYALINFAEFAVFICLFAALPGGIACLIYPWRDMKRQIDASKTEFNNEGSWPPAPKM